MKIIEIVNSLLPSGTDGRLFDVIGDDEYVPSRINVELCPIWPPDIFAVVGTIIERSGCYTEAGPDRNDPASHAKYLSEISAVVSEWISPEYGLFFVPEPIDRRWKSITQHYGEVLIGEVMGHPQLVDELLFLFCVCDEVCSGMGWDSSGRSNPFAEMALASFVVDPNIDPDVPPLPEVPNTLCALVPPESVVVMPKTLTATVGCTIRSLSHHLALLPGASQCSATWALNTPRTGEDESELPIRLLLIPFPFTVPDASFTLAGDPVPLNEGNKTAAFFRLEARWLQSDGKDVTAFMLFNELIEPLLSKANELPRAEGPVTGVVLPECALTDTVADELSKMLAITGVSFFTSGVLRRDEETGKRRNVAKTYAFRANADLEPLEQFKQHRWRLDRSQCDAYGLRFQWPSKADKWWEDIDVSERSLPFFALRKMMSVTVLICEDLARNDPAMSVVRAVGPNLVIALLMDGPQLNVRWPGKYATVLGEDPGSGVLSVTSAAFVDRSNDNWTGDKRRVIGLWRSPGGVGKEIELPAHHHAVVLSISSRTVEQHTLDARSDDYGSRTLHLQSKTALKLDDAPAWL